MKLRTLHCAFVLPYCHYSLYKHSFVLRCIFDGAYLLSSCQAACVCCLCLLLLLLFTGIVCLFDFFSFQFFFIVKLSYSLYAVFLCYLMAFDCQELKGLLTFLLTYLLTYLIDWLISLTATRWLLKMRQLIKYYWHCTLQNVTIITLCLSQFLFIVTLAWTNY